MAEERIGYYNEGLDLADATESMGTPLTNETEDDIHVRQVDLTILAESIAPNETGMLTCTKRAARADTVGMGDIIMRVAVASGTAVALDTSRTAHKTWVFPRGALVLKTGEKLHMHLTEAKDGGTYDCMGDFQFHF